jgi:GNAT superfamily N-acetyltransferase
MRIENFTTAHIEQALVLAMQNYEIERGFVTALPQMEAMPNLKGFAENNMGVAAFDGNKMIGFLCSTPPFENAFQSTDAVGVFSPVCANGTIKEDRAKIYARLYQAAAEKWVKAGATSHAVCLYAHDTTAQEQFFKYGFGLRCVDAIRQMDEIACTPCAGYEFLELSQDEYSLVFPLHTLLNEHQCASPFFMNRKPSTPESFMDSCVSDASRFFAAKQHGKICAYLRLWATGETFVAEQPDYRHIGGAYCLPEHRGKGVYQNLLNFAISILKSENYSQLGVDFESINPTAYGFWLKYFMPYTHSLVRRIDEKILKRKI